jgi:hypothetical protein
MITMNNIHSNYLARLVERDVITSCDYEMCPTIKSNSDSNTMIVVKSDGNSQSIKARSIHRGNGLRSLENSAIGGLAQ